jgi:beta-carotene hydroxylase
MTETTKRQKPNLPPDFYRPESFWVFLFFVYSFLLFIGGGYLNHVVWVSSWPLFGKVPISFLLIFLACNGLHLLGWLAHEGIHLSIANNKFISAAIGGFAGSVLFFSAIGFGISHWPHHRFTNQPGDPDTALQSRQQTFLRRFFLARIFANREYTIAAIKVVLKKQRRSTYKLPFGEQQLRFLSGIGLIFSVLWMSLYIGIGFASPQYALHAFILPYLMLIPVTGLRIYIEHAGTQPGEFMDARSYTSWFYTILLFGNNYHLEHHLYPSVPSYKLPKVHKKLLAEGYFQRFDAPVVSGILAPLRFTTERYPYPDAGLREVIANDRDVPGRKSVANG